MCSVTIRKIGKQVDLGLFIVISPIFIQFCDCISAVRQFCEKDKSFMVIASRNGKIYVFLSLSHVYVSLVASVTIAKLNEVSQPISINYKILHSLNQVVFTT